MKQKMWVRAQVGWWEVGCQCCGRIIFGLDGWEQAMKVAHLHAFTYHGLGGWKTLD